jgi:hypothetical protein
MAYGLSTAKSQVGKGPLPLAINDDVIAAAERSRGRDPAEIAP